MSSENLKSSIRTAHSFMPKVKNWESANESMIVSCNALAAGLRVSFTTGLDHDSLEALTACLILLRAQIEVAPIGHVRNDPEKFNEAFLKRALEIVKECDEEIEARK